MADFVYFKHTISAKPILADRDGEVNTNWVDGGVASLTADATYAHTGTKSFKILSTGTGDFTTNFVSLASGNNATFTVGKTYVVAIWIRDGSAEQIKIETGGVASSTISYTAADVTTGWVCRFFTFTAATASTALKIAVTKTGGGTIWFELEAIYEGNEFPVLIEKGLVRPEKFSMWPQIVNQYLDGSKDTQYRAFIRSLGLRTNALTDAQLLSYLSWCLDNSRKVDYNIDSTQETELSLIPDPEQEFSWYNDLKLSPYLEVNFSEGVARTVFP